MQSELTVDSLAQEIRRVDGNHTIGAGALAEALIPFLTAALSEKQAVEVKVGERDLMPLIRWAHETLWEINPSNYDHDDVCRLNDASVEVILGLAPVLGETHGKSAEWWDQYRTDHPLPALVDVPAVEPVAWREGIDSAPYAATVLASYFDHEVGEWIVQLFVAERPSAPFTHWQLVTRPDETSPPLSREGEDSAEVERLRCLLSRAEEYVIDGVTNAKAEAEMNAPYPARAPRYDAALAEVRQLYADIQAAIAATRSGSATIQKGCDRG